MFHPVVIKSSVPSRPASSIAVSAAFSAVGEPSVASMTGLIRSLLRSDVATEAARELSMRRLGLGEISGVLEPLARLEQVRGQIGPANVDAEALDEAIAFDGGAAGLPKRAPLARAQLGAILSDEAERAGLGFDLAHGVSLRAVNRSGIGPATDLGCGLLPKRQGIRENGEDRSCGSGLRWRRAGALRGNHLAPALLAPSPTGARRPSCGATLQTPGR